MSSGLGSMRKKMLRRSGEAPPLPRCKGCKKHRKLADEHLCQSCFEQRAAWYRKVEAKASGVKKKMEAILAQPTKTTDVEVSTQDVAGPVELVELAGS